ncbi:flagellar hook-length control protein FliK [Paenibacillus sp. DYY-L-2]|uniref:flagellar hook-length control protein FliK n=1 Tax=Paenibacillus sp. DYY-L-2 TaxID=3447013 RepID=UPI003F4FE44E
MNIGPLLRNMMGEVKPGAPKTLELKAGQVVRGTVLSVSEDGQEAVIQVQGVKLHAALETPLREGQTTLLQVQPQTGDGLMKLKPIQTSQTGALSPASLASALEALGLEDTSANREMLQLMQANGIPLTKENASRLLTLTAAKLPTIPLGEWVHAASIALNRGLPLTAETLTGLHQAVFGPPLHTLLASLEEQLGSLLQQGLPENPGAAGAKETNIQGGSGQHPAGPGGTGTSGGSAAAGSSGSSGSLGASGTGEITTAVPAGSNTGSAGAAGPLSAGTGAAGSAQAQAQAGLGQALVQTDTGSLGQLLVKLQQVLDELKGASQPGGAAPGSPASASGEAGNAAAGGEAPARGNAAATAGAAARGEEPAGPSPQSRLAPMAEPWVGRVLKLLGAEHEQQVLRAATPEAGRAQCGAACIRRRCARGRHGRPPARRRACGRAGNRAAARRRGRRPCSAKRRGGKPCRSRRRRSRGQSRTRGGAFGHGHGSGTGGCRRAGNGTRGGSRNIRPRYLKRPAAANRRSGSATRPFTGGGQANPAPAYWPAAAVDDGPDRPVCAGHHVPADHRPGRGADRFGPNRIPARAQRRIGSVELQTLVRSADEGAGPNHGGRAGGGPKGAAENIQRAGSGRGLPGIPTTGNRRGAGIRRIYAVTDEGRTFASGRTGREERAGAGLFLVLCPECI